MALIKIDNADIPKIKSDLASLKTDMVLVKWMMGFVLAFLATLLVKSFSH
jgi:hypothetical protein